MAKDVRYQTIVLIKHGLYEPWMQIAKQGQSKTWLSLQVPDGIKIVHFYGIPVSKCGARLEKLHEWSRWHSRFTCYLQRIFDIFILFPFLLWIPKVKKDNKLGMRDQELQCQVLDTYYTLRWKQLAAYKYLLDNFSFEYLYEVNGSSYVNLSALLRYLQDIPELGFYGGLLPWQEASFISGASRLTSYDVLERLLKNRKNWDVSLLEDVAIGKLLTSLGFKPNAINSSILEQLEDVANISQFDLYQNFHFRTKSGPLNQRNDIALMAAIHKKILESNL